MAWDIKKSSALDDYDVYFTGGSNWSDDIVICAVEVVSSAIVSVLLTSPND